MPFLSPRYPAWDYSAWVRTYALFLEERLECFRVLKYDVETEKSSVREKKESDGVRHAGNSQVVALEPEPVRVEVPWSMVVESQGYQRRH